MALPAARALSRLFWALSFLALAGCLPTADWSGGAGAVPPPGSTPEFLLAAERVEPVARALCREKRIARRCDFIFAVDTRPDQPANAFQTLDRSGRPWVVLTPALIAQARNADELAFVMGHEAGHHILGHIPKREDQAREGAALAGVLASVAGASPEEVRKAQSIGAALAAEQYSQDFELEADVLGAEISWRAGFDAVKGAGFLARLPDPGNQPWGSHPANARRRALVAQTVAALEAGGA